MGQRKATPISRALRYITMCVMSKTDPSQHSISDSTTPFDIMVYISWKEQYNIGWVQLFRERISSKWALVQGI